MLKEILKDAQGVPTGNYKDIAGGTLYADNPIGTILPYGGTTAPTGWFLCQGQSLLRADYAELFAVIGTAFGSADSTHFNIPDLRGEFLRGAGTNSHTRQGSGGNVGDHQDATLQVASMATTTYIDVYALNADGTNFINSDVAGNVSLVGYSRVSTPLNSGGGAKPMAMRPTNTSVNYIIKAKMVAFPADLQSAMVDYMNNQNELSDYEEITLGTSASNATQVQYDGFINVNVSSAGSGVAYISNDNKSTWKVAWNSTGDTGFGKAGFIVVAKGDYVYAPGYNSAKECYARFYKNRDYTKRA